MRRIVHLSDIHFGSVDLDVAECAAEKINTLSPDVVVVSGDLTQRARSEEFRAARAFLDELPHPQIVVPGNHDIPLYNVYHRFAKPLDKFRRYITDDLTPSFVDDELAIVGINTARAFTIKGGRINRRQVAGIRDKLCELQASMLKVIVTHHPFELPEGFDKQDLVGRAAKMMPAIADCGADVFLAGHLHSSHILSTAKRYKLDNGLAALVIQAGTATSTRARGEAHSFNVIEFEHPTITVKRLECQSLDMGFREAETRRYDHGPNGWEAAREM
jgi:3',5'-cyclic AMP phosphodiesterase CpdA